MTSLHPSFRRLILENLSELDSEKLNRYEGLLALRLELVHQRSLTPASILGKGLRPVVTATRGEIDALIRKTTEQANRIIAPVRTEFDALHKLWMARRNLAFRQGGFLQIPTTTKGLRFLFQATRAYFGTQREVFGVLTKYRLRNKSNRKRLLAIAVLILLVLFGLDSLDRNRKPNDDRPPDPKPPDSTIVR